MVRIIRRKAGMMRATTIRERHQRRKPKGGYTWVRRHDMNVRKRQYSHVLVHNVPIFKKIKNQNIWPQNTTQDESDYIDKVLNKSLTITSAAFPQYAPLIETGRFLYNNREKVKDAVNSIFSYKSADKKLDELVELTKQSTISYAKSNLSRTCAKELTELIDSRHGFSVLDDKLGLDLDFRTESIFKDFFQSSVENLIQKSL